MFRNNIAFKGICTIILFITMGVSQVSLTIKNVDTDAGTLDIYMTNTAGCSFCDDPSFDNQIGCEVSGNNTAGGTWTFDTTINEATCELTATNGNYFDGNIAGFQFILTGVTITGASGGSAELGEFTIQVSETEVLGFLFGGTSIPAGAGTLTTISFSNFDGIGICLPYSQEGSASDHTPVIADTDGDAIDSEVGVCYCGSAYPADCAGECGGDAMEDGCGTCDDNSSNDCVLSISQIGLNLPIEFSISQNIPNPFNPVTSITFDVAEMDEVSLIVYDLTGKEVATLVSGTYTPGTYNVEWNAVNNAGDDIVSGMYIYRYISSEKAITRKMLYLK